MSKRFLNRLILVLVVVVPLVAAFIWIRSKPQGRVWVDIPPVNTKGFVAALRESENGSRLVSIAPDGTVREPNGGDSFNDGDFTWHVDGRRLLFISNRSEDGSEQIFSWAPDRKADALQETPSGAVRSAPWCFPLTSEYLFCSRGDVWAITWPERRLRPVMPPAGKEKVLGGEEQSMVERTGNVSETDQWITSAWNSLANDLESEGFESGRLFASGDYFGGVCRTPRGPVLVIAYMKPGSAPEASPMAAEAGESLEISVVPDKPLIAVSVVNFRYPLASQVPQSKRRADGTFIRDYQNALLVYDMSARKKIAVYASDKPGIALMQPALSPKGDEIAVCLNVDDGGTWKPRALLILPLQSMAFNNGIGSTLVQGEVYDPSWSKDGSQLTYVKGGDVFVIDRTGQNEKNLTNGKGRFRKPQLSPAG